MSRADDARSELIGELIARGWDKGMVERYFETKIEEAVWRGAVAATVTSL